MPTIAEEIAGAPVLFVDDPDGARHVVGLRLRPGADPGRELLALHRHLSHLAGDYGLRSVDLPAPAGLHRLDETFGAKVRHGRPSALLRLPAGMLSEQPGRVRRSTLAWQVRHALTAALGGPGTTLPGIARTVAVHPRTLQRALLDEGLTFAEILDCVRRERARTYLTETPLPLTEISTRLGFAEPAVLTRCARRWWGRTPSQLRAGPPA
jgi:AraC-like DNA-binding protein